MGLIERLIGVEFPKIGVHQFMAAMGEWERSLMTRTEVISAFEIAAGEEAELDALATKIVPIPESISLGAIVVLTNVGSTYDSLPAAKGLGFVRVEGAGITGLEFVVRYNKVGTGTLSWQLWDDTIGVELAVINDSAAAGDNKQGVVDIVPGVPPAVGLHTLRVRCKSTVAADDPVFYGASIRIRRDTAMWAELLHEVLLLAEGGVKYIGGDPPAPDATLVRARLGL